MDPFLIRALVAGLGLAIIAAPLGCFVVWQRMSYFGETIAQASLIGIALGLALGVSVTLGALVFALAMAGLLIAMSRQKLVPLDAVMGLLAHAALAIGVLSASLARGPAVDLMSYLFGDIYAVSTADLWWVGLGGAVVLAIIMRLWEPLLLVSIQEDLAQAEGVPTGRIKALFIVVLALTIAIAMKIVGILLAIAFLIMPAVAARPLSKSPETMALVAAAIAMAAVVGGLLLSLALDAPGGASIVVVMAGMAGVSIGAGGLGLIRGASRGPASRTS
jgi:zinc transport system permease protein